MFKISYLYLIIPPTTPTQKYKPSTLLQKEAATSPAPERQPPKIMIGRLPYLLTRILLTGPGNEMQRKKKNVRICTKQRKIYLFM